MAAIETYDDLKDEIADWIDRDDLTAKIPAFIAMCEAQFDSRLRTVDQEVSTAIAINEENTDLPSDFLELRSIYVDGTDANAPATVAIVANAIRVSPVPTEAVTVNLDYFAKLTPLSSTNQSNWLLARYPNSYLYGALYFAEAFNDNPTRASQWKGLFDEQVEQIAKEGKSKRYGFNPLAPATCSQVRGATC